MSVCIVLSQYFACSITENGCATEDILEPSAAKHGAYSSTDWKIGRRRRWRKGGLGPSETGMINDIYLFFKTCIMFRIQHHY